MRKARLALCVASLLTVAPGCGTVGRVLVEKNPQPYGGVRLNVECLRSGDRDGLGVVIQPVAVLDMPLSAVFDTALLPFTIPITLLSTQPPGDETSAPARDPGLVAGVRFAEEKKWQKAIDEHSRTIARDPGSVGAISERGVASQAVADLDAAIADQTKAIALDPGFAQAWVRRAGARLKKGEREAALAEAKGILQVGDKLRFLGHFWPSDEETCVALGDAFLDAHDSKAALVYLDAAVTVAGILEPFLDPESATVLNSDGTLYWNPDYAKFARAWFLRGIAKESLHDFRGAWADYRCFVRLAPNDPRAPRVLEHMEQLIDR